MCDYFCDEYTVGKIPMKNLFRPIVFLSNLSQKCSFTLTVEHCLSTEVSLSVFPSPWFQGFDSSQVFSVFVFSALRSV